MRRLIAAGLLLSSVASAEPGRPVGNQDAALSALLVRLGVTPSDAVVRHAAWNAPYGAWCFQLEVRSGPFSGRQLSSAVSRRGTVEVLSRGCAPRPPVTARLPTSSMEELVQQLVINLAAVQNYPLPAKERRVEGMSRVHVTVRREDGAVLRACVVSSSGDADLDRQALHMARTVTVPLFPPAKTTGTETFIVPIRFALSRRPASAEGAAPDRDPGPTPPPLEPEGGCGPTVSRLWGGPPVG
ncbi:energy transducer TonB [Pararoseomonas sp. SCSIO 73927]|uniref:energy transducer TonB n=1 Tax=Pararoseomonas sp. SCSIO 73927 TaxID=3114537 RepID=UPI0030CECA0D